MIYLKITDNNVVKVKIDYQIGSSLKIFLANEPKAAAEFLR
jgi:hypothetical protein